MSRENSRLCGELVKRVEEGLPSDDIVELHSSEISLSEWLIKQSRLEKLRSQASKVQCPHCGRVGVQVWAHLDVLTRCWCGERF